MATLTIRLTESKHQRLKHLAAYKHISINKLIDELSTVALVEFDAESRFCIRATRGKTKRGLALLDKLDRHFNSE